MVWSLTWAKNLERSQMYMQQLAQATHCAMWPWREYVIVMSVEEFLLVVILIDCDWFPGFKCAIERWLMDQECSFSEKQIEWNIWLGIYGPKSKMKLFCDLVLKTNIWLRFLRIMHFYANQIGFWKSNEGQAFETTASLSQSDNFCNPTTFLGVSL